jgi:hypothetical protein
MPKAPITPPTGVTAGTYIAGCGCSIASPQGSIVITPNAGTPVSAVRVVTVKGASRLQVTVTDLDAHVYAATTVNATTTRYVAVAANARPQGGNTLTVTVTGAPALVSVDIQEFNPSGS